MEKNQTHAARAEQWRFVKIEELSERIGKTPTTIRTCATNEKYFHLIPRPIKLPNSRRLLWREEDIQAWINQATPVGQVRRRRGAPTKAERAARVLQETGNVRSS